MHLPLARHEYLLREVELRGSVRCTEAAQHLGVSEVTIRRDITELVKAGRVARVYGGAIAVGSRRGPQAAKALVGLVVPSTTAHFPQVVRGMEALAPTLRARLILGVSHYRPAVEMAQVDRLLALGVQGLVIAPTTRDRTPAELSAWLRSIPVPVVVIERRIDATSRLHELDMTRTDHAHGGVIAVEHLHGLGHRRVALGAYDRTPTARFVREGFATAMERLGLDPGPDVSLSKGEEDPAQLVRELEDLLDACLASGTRAVVLHTDDHASRFVETVLDRGLRVPEDIAVVAYDDENAELAAVPLTAVCAPRRELGRQALQMLVDRLSSPDDAGRTPRHLDLLPRLTVRESCGARASAAS